MAISLLVSVAAGCVSAPCPKGYDKRDDKCYRKKDAGLPGDSGNAKDGDAEAISSDDSGTVDDADVPADAGAHFSDAAPDASLAHEDCGPTVDAGDGGCEIADAAACIEHAACCSDSGCACVTSLECGCQDGFKICNGACVLASACCTEDDCASGTTCMDGTCKEWCEAQKRPDGVAAADYRCLDFDQGLPPASAWERRTEDAGTLQASSARAFSAPESLLTEKATLNWSVTGAKPLSDIVFSAMVSPAAHPTVLPEPLDIELVRFTVGDQSSGDQSGLELRYTYKGSLLTVQGAIADFSGLYLRPFDTGGASLPNDIPLYAVSDSEPLTLAENVWNSLVVSASADGLTVAVNDKQATPQRKLLGGDTNGAVRFGSDSSLGLNVYYDNVVISVRRAP